MTTEKPLPCPFCGGEPKVVVSFLGRSVVGCDSLSCSVQPSTLPQSDEAEAVATWNTRAGSTR
jgi:hypothetical protein